MSQSPIPKALSTLLSHNVKALLIGGQACIIYGAAEFSRDIDLAIMVSPENLKKLNAACDQLQAEPVFFPAVSAEALLKGHACHFRCRREDVKDLRIDILGVMRGVAPFPDLWGRREEIEIPGAGKIAVMGLPDLVKAKKTQRDKDWPMLRRLVEADIYRAAANPSEEKISFWLNECRTPELLISLSSRYPGIAGQTAAGRPLIKAAMGNDPEKVRRLLADEEAQEMQADRRYWDPLKAELELWRRQRSRENPATTD